MRRLTTYAAAAAISTGTLLALAPSASAAPVPYTCTPAAPSTTLDLATSVTDGVLGALTATASVGGAPADLAVQAQGTVTLELVKDGAVVGTRVATLPNTAATTSGTTANATWTAAFSDTSTPTEAGSYVLRHQNVALVLSAGENTINVTCTAGQQETVAAWTVATTAAARPTVVRTDAYQPQPTTLPVWLVGAGLVGAAGLAGGLVAARATRRD